MNRKTKFRGIVNDANHNLFGEFYYGSYVESKRKGHHHLIQDINTNHDVFVNPKTLGEFTGILDKHNSEVFEGDIVSQQKKGDNFPSKWVVTFEHQHVGFILKRLNWYSKFNITYGDGEIYIDETIEVIGNIHKHPTLING